MKSYTIEEYLKQFPHGLGFERSHHWAFSGNYCSCTRFYSFEGLTKAWEDCPNCLGYGIMPIPMSELK